MFLCVLVQTDLDIGNREIICFPMFIYTFGQIALIHVKNTTLNNSVQNVSSKIFYLKENNVTSRQVFEGKNDIDFVCNNIDSSHQERTESSRY